MNWPAECAAVIPCLNEDSAVARVVLAVREHLHNTIVVDDGSFDRTTVVAEQAGAEVLRHAQTQGKGAALQTGWRRARDRGFNWALTLDGDGQHAPDDIPSFFQCAERTQAALVVGNRMAACQNMPWLRQWVNRWMSRRLTKAAGQPLNDTQCGFRLMNLPAWAALPISSTHFEIESEVLLAFAAAGHRIEFVPIRVIYQDERSKIRPLRDTLRWFQWWWHTRRTLAKFRR